MLNQKSLLKFKAAGTGNNIMLPVILAMVFIRPFISSLAFPFLEIVYSLSLLVFLGVYLVFRKPEYSKVRSLKYPFAAFCLVLYLAVLFSSQKAESFACLYQYACGLGFFLFAITLSDKEKDHAVRVILWGGLAVGLLGVYQYLFGFRHVLDYLSGSVNSSSFALDYLQRRRIFAPFVTPSALGGYLAMVILLSLSGKKSTWIAWILFPIFFLTKSPGAFLSLFLALLIYISVQGKFKKKDFMILAVLLLLLTATVVMRSFTNKYYLQPGFSVNMRLHYWRESLALIKAHPWLGAGLGNFSLGSSRFAHNSYLQFWSETGLFGLAGFSWFIFSALRICLKNLKESVDKKYTAGLLAATSVFLIHNFMDFTFFLPEVSFIWWVILGLAV
ncbi:MAG: O-antigen ligase family protein [Candidatus Omnitrophica bacterium]|jgi:O-antigen ligase|nr:O-antigen ligase family protein [Candidatus Omnitrophota bacterium]MDD3274288.1 O-antigen ligase family protein [Candidatus Omnitrophota bacterium]